MSAPVKLSTIRAAEITVEIFNKWSPARDGEVDDFLAHNYPTEETSTLALAAALFDDLDEVAQANDLVDMLKSLRPQ